MKRRSIVFVIFTMAMSIFIAAKVQSTELTGLTCEYKKDPIGITVRLPRFSWKILSGEKNQMQTAYQILVASSPSLLTASRADLWNSGKTVSDQSTLVDYKGKELGSRQKCWWTVRVWDQNEKATKWSTPAYFEIGLLNPEDWQADWIKTAIVFEEYSYPSPLLRKEFAIGKKVRAARLYCTSLGLYEFYLNGHKVGDQVFTPGWTSYDKRLQYQVYDVTTMLRNGANAAGVMLGNGWYRAFDPNRNVMQDIEDLEVLAMIEVEFTDGTKQAIKTDNTWKSSTAGLIRSELFYGEVYDARLEKQGWNTPGYDDSAWKGVMVTDSKKNHLTGFVSPPVRKLEEISPIAVIYTPEGDTVLDMGQNMVGWNRLKVECPAGTTITLRHAEVLDQNGNFYTENLRRAEQVMIYTCKGGGVTEVFEPHFTFYGYRYVAITGYPKEVTKDILTGIVINSDLEITGSFSCNNKLINQLQQNIIWGQKGNFLDVPTDCPQRNERLGWTGDAQVFAPTACYNMQSAGFFTKWLYDLAADQHENGVVPVVIPNVLMSYDPNYLGGAHGWSDASVIVPWVLYQSYGDTRILDEQYTSMKAWVEYNREGAGDNYLIFRTTNRQFGDWLSFATTRSDYPGATTDISFISSAYFYRSTDLLSRSAEILGKKEDAEKYKALAAKIKEAFIKEFVTSNGRLSPNTQTAYVMALSFGLLPSELEKSTAARLAGDVNEFGHITTGFLGTADICHMLSRYGYMDEAYKLLYRKEYPSWLYPVTKGATTIWERWDGIKADGSFQNPGMNSFNHYAYGAVGDWLYKVVAGINPVPEVPGYKKIIIKPRPGGEMNDVRGSHESSYGAIVSEWMIRDNKLTLNVSIPPNTTAEVFIPSTAKSATIDGTLQDNLPMISESGLKYHFLKKEIGSGKYVFETSYNLK